MKLFQIPNDVTVSNRDCTTVVIDVMWTRVQFEAHSKFTSTSICTLLVCRMPHRRETKLQPSRAKSGYQLSCCLLSHHFLWGILCMSTVVNSHGTTE